MGVDVIGRALAGLAIGVLSLAGQDLVAETEFVFSIPSGWTDLSPSAPAANFQGIPDELTKEAMSGRYLAFAVDWNAADKVVGAAFNALQTPSSGVLTRARLDRMWEGAEDAARQRGQRLVVLEKEMVTISGASAGRVVYDRVMEDGRTRQMFYALPSLENVVALNYESSPEDFARYRPIFEASAAATKGVREPTLLARLFLTDRGHHVLGVITGFLVGGAFFFFLIRRIRG